MDRRSFCDALSKGSLLACSGLWLPAHALGLADLSDAETSKGLKAALDKGALAAVGKLGARDGFLANPKVKIPLPGFLENAAKVARMLGMNKQIDELVVAMNRAAEAAVPESKQMLADAVKTMSVTDAKNILTGGQTSVTQFFRTKTEKPLFQKFLPVVTRTTSKVGLARRYNDLVAKVPAAGSEARIEDYVTTKSLDGLFYMIGQEEIAIRQNPLGYGSDAIRKVFGALK